MYPSADVYSTSAAEGASGGFPLEPAFWPLRAHYNAALPYHAATVRVSAEPLHCAATARIHHRAGPLQSANCTLGVGENRVTVVVEAPGSPPAVYTLLLQRRPASFGEPPFNPARNYSVCALRQECEYQFSPGEPCGLQPEPPPWSALQRRALTLPACATGDAFGRWVVPCDACESRASCVWSEARWLPYGCVHRRLTLPQLRRCLHNKKKMVPWLVP
ncbi:cadherin-like and PC-esterase domain-containing protein 1 [Schistocerca nitens]|uniref:cadherin-like and PC-esterase domain-containing protein 1 n=1 Tax=Schistocerca nitens TaxID=7011 RepID=UPI002117A634|nr:cadherin-like and PC-esterase domain-containing protein 1 [Schistocerca nitens]